jgi:protein TonB
MNKVNLFFFLVLLIGPLAGYTQQDSTQSFEPWQPAKVEKMPSFPGGPEAMYKFLYSEMRYPADAKRFKVSGQVITQFVINAAGKMEDIDLIRGMGYGLDEEAIRVITVMQEKYTWTPGLHNDKPVAVKYALPLKFVLQ